MSGQVLKIIEQHFYVGVIIDHQLSWKPHISGKAMELIGFLNCNLQTCSKELSYKRFVLPVLDYAIVCIIYLGSLNMK